MEENQLSFDEAQYEGAASAAAPCTGCGAGIEHEYWTWEDRVLCTRCKAGTEQTFAKASSGKSFLKAWLFGGLTALGCGIAYAVFVAVTDIQLALATIGIAFVIANVVRRAAQGVGGRRFQILAVALTYFASAMGYAPAIWEGMKGTPSEETASSGTPPADAASGSIANDRTDTREQDRAMDAASKTPPTAAAASGTSAGQLLLAILFLIGITLAAPFLAIADAPIGFLIVMFGLWEAWKQSRAGTTSIEGPFQVTASPMEPSIT